MVDKRAAVSEPQRVAKASGLGIAVCLLAALASAWAQQGTVAPVGPTVAAAKETGTTEARPDLPKMPSSDYVVSPEDVLDVFVMDVPEVSRTYRVSSNGFLTLPLLPEPIAVTGETLDQLAHLIATKFHDAGMLNNAQVTVSLRETTLHSVLVSGEVKTPQAYPIFGPTRLLDLLVKAGGITNSAGDEAVILRGEMGARADLAESAETGTVNPSINGQSFTLNIRKLVETGGDTTNILLYPGDRVTVPRAELVYIMGAVARPGGYVMNESRKQITVVKALALAGDVSPVARKNHMVILRQDPFGPEDKRVEIPVDYKDIVKGKIADVRLKPDDILYVPESAKAKAMRTTVSSATAVATMGGEGLLIYH
ncbi:MAG: polysaccharide biosynthesis/export family protein [Terriglobia bacterium]